MHRRNIPKGYWDRTFNRGCTAPQPAYRPQSAVHSYGSDTDATLYPGPCEHFWSHLKSWPTPSRTCVPLPSNINESTNIESTRRPGGMAPASQRSLMQIIWADDFASRSYKYFITPTAPTPRFDSTHLAPRRAGGCEFASWPNRYATHPCAGITGDQGLSFVSL
jgi:hypothetical protein